MGVGYQVVQWNKHKKIYDGLLLGGVVLYLVGFIVIGSVIFAKENPVQVPILLMRAFGSCAFIMLTMILMIGPLARLNDKFLPLLYNRRHFGVLTFIIGLLHALVATVWYHFFSDVNPFLSIFTTNNQITNLQAFPFELFGILALLILFVMAATSHDFWLKNLSAPFWKTLHMFVYVAYGALVMHIALGYLQSESSVVVPILVAASFGLVILLHLMAGFKDARESATNIKSGAGWIAVAAVGDIPESRAHTVNVADGERIAVFKYDGKISAISAVCAHQNGPLDEGKIIDGCVTCPWHGYQYDPANGQSPPPYTEKIHTYKVKLEGDMILVDPKPLPPGTPVEPARIGSE